MAIKQLQENGKSHKDDVKEMNEVLDSAQQELLKKQQLIEQLNEAVERAKQDSQAVFDEEEKKYKAIIAKQQSVMKQLEAQSKKQQRLIQELQDRIDAPAHPVEVQKQLIIDQEQQLIKKGERIRELEFRLMQLETDDVRGNLQTKVETLQRDMSKLEAENIELKKMNLELIEDMEKLCKKQ